MRDQDLIRDNIAGLLDAATARDVFADVLAQLRQADEGEAEAEGENEETWWVIAFWLGVYMLPVASPSDPSSDSSSTTSSAHTPTSARHPHRLRRSRSPGLVAVDLPRALIDGHRAFCTAFDAPDDIVACQGRALSTPARVVRSILFLHSVWRPAFVAALRSRSPPIHFPPNPSVNFVDQVAKLARYCPSFADFTARFPPWFAAGYDANGIPHAKKKATRIVKVGDIQAFLERVTVPEHLRAPLPLTVPRDGDNDYDDNDDSSELPETPQTPVRPDTPQAHRHKRARVLQHSEDDDHDDDDDNAIETGRAESHRLSAASSKHSAGAGEASNDSESDDSEDRVRSQHSSSSSPSAFQRGNNPSFLFDDDPPFFFDVDPTAQLNDTDTASFEHGNNNGGGMIAQLALDPPGAAPSPSRTRPNGISTPMSHLPLFAQGYIPTVIQSHLYNAIPSVQAIQDAESRAHDAVVAARNSMREKRAALRKVQEQLAQHVKQDYQSCTAAVIQKLLQERRQELQQQQEAVESFRHKQAGNANWSKFVSFDEDAFLDDIKARTNFITVLEEGIRNLEVLEADIHTLREKMEDLQAEWNAVRDVWKDFMVWAAAGVSLGPARDEH